MHSPGFRSRTRVFALVGAATASISIWAPVAHSQALNPRIDPNQILNRWEAAWGRIDTIAAECSRIDRDEATGEERHLRGRVMLQSPNLLYVEWTEDRDGPGAPKPVERVICDGRKVYRVTGDPPQLRVYDMEEGAARVALSAAPLPYLRGLTAEAIREKFEIKAWDTGNFYSIHIKPKLRAEVDCFSQALVLLDKKNLLPRGIRLFSPDGREVRSIVFNPAKMVTNRELRAEWFSKPKI